MQFRFWSVASICGFFAPKAVPAFNENGNFVPSNPDSLVGLLVTRKDRVDRMIRPYTVDTDGTIDRTKTQYDVVKLSNSYWKEQRAYVGPCIGGAACLIARRNLIRQVKEARHRASAP